MKIQLEENDDVMRYRICFVCGEQYQTAPIATVVYTIQGVRMARICPACLKAGPEGIKGRAHEYAERLAQAAERAKRLAEAFDGEQIEMPTFADLEKRLQEVSGSY